MGWVPLYIDVPVRNDLPCLQVHPSIQILIILDGERVLSVDRCSCLLGHFW